MSRFLTDGEILTVVSNVTDSPFFKTYYVSQLKQVVLKPSLIPKLIVALKEKHEESLVRPGENVGIICAQSIGEKFTQSTLNTFHKAGLLVSGATKGIPRVQELLNVSKNPKRIFYSVRLISKPTSFNQIYEETKNLKAVTVGCLAKTVQTVRMENHPWRAVFHKMYARHNLDEGQEVLKIQLDRRLLVTYNVTHWDFIQNLSCCEIDPEMNFLYLPNHTDLLTLIKGDAAIIRVGYTEIADEWELSVETHQKRFRKILGMSIVDPLRTCSSNVWDIYETLGIEAVREYLLQELMSETSDIHITHLTVLVDKMVFTGDIFSVNRYSTKKENIGVLAKASFEETFDHFLTAAINNETDNTKGLSASIICGKKPSCNFF